MHGNEKERVYGQKKIKPFSADCSQEDLNCPCCDICCTNGVDCMYES